MNKIEQNEKRETNPAGKDVVAKFNTKFKGKNLEIPSKTEKR